MVENAPRQRRSLFRQMRRGAGYLPGYGDHPGTQYLVGLIVIAGAAGANNGGWLGAAISAAIMAAGMVPIWLAGCVGRADAYDRARAAISKAQGAA